MWLCETCATAAGLVWGHYDSANPERPYHGGFVAEGPGLCGCCGTTIKRGATLQWHPGQTREALALAAELHLLS